jgi:hypothetical protein
MRALLVAFAALALSACGSDGGESSEPEDLGFFSLSDAALFDVPADDVWDAGGTDVPGLDLVEPDAGAPTPLAVVAVEPAPGAQGVSRFVSVRVTFDRPVADAQPEGVLSLEALGSGVPGTVGKPAAAVLELVSSAPLPAGALVTVRVEGAVAQDGAVLADPALSGFTTASALAVSAFSSAGATVWSDGVVEAGSAALRVGDDHAGRKGRAVLAFSLPARPDEGFSQATLVVHGAGAVGAAPALVAEVIPAHPLPLSTDYAAEATGAPVAAVSDDGAFAFDLTATLPEAGNLLIRLRAATEPPASNGVADARLLWSDDGTDGPAAPRLDLEAQEVTP